MKSKIILLTGLAFLLLAQVTSAQKPLYPKPKIDDSILFQRKPSPAVLNTPQKVFYPAGKSSGTIEVSNQHSSFQPQLMGNAAIASTPAVVHNANTPNSVNPISNTGNFHLTRDINTSTPGSYPNSDNKYNFTPPYSLIKDIAYFGADDGIHGMELWRSDGTSAGTYLVKDINAGALGSGVTSIIVVNGKLFFSAYTDADGWEPWTSDGTEAGTKEIIQIDNSLPHNYSEGFLRVGDKVFFATNSDFGSDLFITDGTAGGTKLLYNFNLTDPYAGYITEPVAAHGLLFFSAWTPTYGRELWRSDGTAEGTYMVKDIGPDQSDYYSPLQLTAYADKLYYSGDDGTGRRLWYSDGTAAGTLPAPNPRDVLTQNEYTNYGTNMPFAVMNQVLYFAGFTYADGGGLYKYDASRQTGVSLVKDLTPLPDVDFITAPELRAINNTLFFKVINSINGYHDELWASKGDASNTQAIKVFDPGHVTFNYFGVSNDLYFAENDAMYGTEPWKSDGTASGTFMLKDIFKGSQNSDPFFFTPYKGKVLFNAGDGKIGTELWITNGTEAGTVPVKDINTASTNNSDAGLFIKGIASIEDGVIFGAYEPEHGGELYKSDGTKEGTIMLNDIAEGPNWSYPNSFIFKNGFDYFIGDNLNGTALYKSDGTKQGLQKIIYDIDRSIYYVTNFNVTENGKPFYLLANRYTGMIELWRSDGTAAGTYSLSTNLYLNYNDYIVTVGNIAFFEADDGVTGPQLWQTDGTQAGTKIVKNINPNGYGSYPYSLFPYKNELYFGAYDGNGYYYSLWKTDGTPKGTVKVKDVTPAYWDYYGNYYSHFYSQYFCVSNNTLFFNGADYNANPYQGGQLWSTKGTTKNTKLVKIINPYYDAFPANLVDVNGTLFFLADDGMDGGELWRSNGTAEGTMLVKDITPGYYGSSLNNLCSAGGKLYFVKDGFELWSSDGGRNTDPVADPGLSNLSSLQSLTAGGNKLFFSAYSYKYGTELYAGDVASPKFFPTTLANKKVTIDEFNTNKFDAILYPNPANNISSLQIKGNTRHTDVTISDVTGKIIWQLKNSNNSEINLPMEKLSPGVYMVKVESSLGKKTLKLLKQ